MLNLSKSIAFFDLETTGIDIAKDRIIEIAILKITPENEQQTLRMLLNPGIPIPKEASAIHGIHDEDVKNEPCFKDVAEDIAAFLGECDFGGYNSNRFDIPMLVEEFLRAGIEIDTDNRRLIDVQRIFHQMEKRTLEAAYQFYCNKNLENAHSALADVQATYEVLCAQLQRYKEHLQNDVDYLHNFSKEDHDFVDFSRRMVYKNGEACFNFGKHKGKPVAHVLEKEPGYYNWIMDNDFPLHTKKKLEQLKFKMLNGKKL